MLSHGFIAILVDLVSCIRYNIHILKHCTFKKNCFYKEKQDTKVEGQKIILENREKKKKCEEKESTNSISENERH